MSLSDLIPETDADEDLNDSAPTPSLARDSVPQLLGRLALEAGLSRTQRRMLAASGTIIIVHAPDKDLAELIGDAIQRMERAPLVITRTERKKSVVPFQQRSFYLDQLAAGRSVIFVTQDPGLLDREVLAAADTTITVPKLTVMVVRGAIGQVTGVPSVDWGRRTSPGLVSPILSRPCARRAQRANASSACAALPPPGVRRPTIPSCRSKTCR